MPNFEILVDGQVVSSTLVSSGSGLTSSLFANINYTGVPSSLSFRFGGTGGEAGRTIEISSVKINGYALDFSTSVTGTSGASVSGTLLSMQSQQGASVNTASVSSYFTSPPNTSGESGNVAEGTNIIVSNGSTTYDGGAGTDTLDLSTNPTKVFVSLRANRVDMNGDGVMDTIIRGIENVTTTSFDDVVYGTDTANLIYGLGGADTLRGYAGDDTIYGGDGDDTIYGDDGNDTLHGGNGADKLYGGNGDDIFLTSPGNDTISGDAGSDTINFAASAVKILANIGTGTADTTGDGVTDITFSGIENLILSNYADLAYGDANANILSGLAGNDKIYGGAGNDTILGGAGNDILYGDDGDDTVYGGADHDYVYGGNGADTLYGEAGIDRAYGGAGNDTIFGGDDGDYLYGEADDDTISGEGGDDRIYGGDGVDTLYGNAGFDRIYGGAGNDVLRGGDGADMLWGEDGDDTLYADAEAAVLSGGNGNDILHGSTVGDELYGNEGTDLLYGYGGNDLLKGQGGTDTLDAGDGDDTIFFDADDTFIGGAGNDVLTVEELSTAAITISAGTIARFSGIDTIRLDNYKGAAAANSLDISIDLVDELSDSRTIYITGDAAMDTVTIRDYSVVSNFVEAVEINGITYDHFSKGSNHIYIQQGLNVDGNGHLNAAPNAQDDSFNGSEDTTVTGNVLSDNGNGADSDPHGDALSVTAGTFATTHGSVTLLADGSFTYTPTANYNGADSFTYTINDAFGATDTATVTITLAAVNDAPVAKNDSFNGSEDTVITGNVLSNNGSGSDSDIDGDVLSVTAGTFATTHGSVTLLADGSFTYTPAANYNGADSFTYTLRDGSALTATGTVSLTLAAVNDAPVAKNDSFNGTEDTVITGNLLSNNGAGADSDPEGDTLSVIAGTFATTHGSVTILADGSFTFTPTANYNGADSFTYTLLDSQGGSATGSVSLTLAAVNDAPVAKNDSFNGNEDATVTGNVLANNGSGADSDPDGDTLSVTAGTFATAQGGSVTLLANGDFTYTPAANFVGTDSFTYTLRDGSALTATGTVSLTLANVDITGTAGDDTLTGTNGPDEIYGLGGNDTLTGGSGSDKLYGGDGNDTLYYDANDTFDGGTGTDTLALAAGFSGAITSITSSTQMARYVGIDTFKLDNGGTANSLTITISYIDEISDNRTIYITGDAGADSVTISGYTKNTDYVETVQLNGVVYEHYLRSLNHVYVQRGLLSDGMVKTGSVVIGTEGADSLSGTSGADVLLALGGNDTLNGAGGADELNGGDGDDTLIYYDNTAKYIGGAGFDTIKMGAGVTATVALLTTLSDKSIEMIDLANSGGAAANTFNLDFTYIDNFNTTLTLYVKGDIGTDSVAITNYTKSTSYQDTQVINGAVYERFLSGGNTLYLQRGLNSTGTIDGGNGLETVREGTSSGDSLAGTGGNDLFFGYDGNDTLDGAGGTDVYFAGNGDDTMVMYNTTSAFRGGAGFDTIALGAGVTANFALPDLLTDKGIEAINMKNAGGAAANVLTLDYNYIDNFTTDRTLYVKGDIGTDSVVISNYTKSTNYVETLMIDGTVYEYFLKSSNLLYLERGLNSTGTVDGGSGHQTGVQGTADGDTLYGTAADEILLGLGGDDWLQGGGGTDSLMGGAGNDTLVFDDILDYYAGGAGDDTLALLAGNNASFNLNQVLGMKGIENVDLSNGTANTLSFSTSYIDDFTGGTVLYVRGDTGLDTVDVSTINFTTNFVETVAISGVTYDHYLRGSNHLYVQADLNVI